MSDLDSDFRAAFGFPSVPKLIQRLVLTCCVTFWLSLPSWGLVDPELDVWQELCTEVKGDLGILGDTLLGEALSEVGELAASLNKAPLAELMAELEVRRDLKFKYFTPWHVKSKTELRYFLEEQLEKDYPAKKVEQDEAMLKVLGLVPMDFKIIPFLKELYAGQIAGAYDPSTDQFFLVDTRADLGLVERWKGKAGRVAMGQLGLSTDMTSVVIIHELDHALGGQHFSLKEIFKASVNWSLDQTIAATALVEGDATFVMVDHQHKRPATSRGAKTQLLGMDMMTDILVKFPIPLPGMGSFSKAPLFYQKSLIFPYYGGAEFVTSLRHSRSDWSAVDRAYRDLPNSTEQVYRPYEYMVASWKPKIPDFDKIGDTFGDWEKVKDDTGGEFLLRIVTETYGVPEPREVCEGWNGDRIRVFRNKKSGALGFYWVVNWDAKALASKFYHSLGSHLPFVVELEDRTTTISLAFDEKARAALKKKLALREKPES